MSPMEQIEKPWKLFEITMLLVTFYISFALAEYALEPMIEKLGTLSYNSLSFLFKGLPIGIIWGVEMATILICRSAYHFEDKYIERAKYYTWWHHVILWVLAIVSFIIPCLLFPLIFKQETLGGKVIYIVGTVLSSIVSIIFIILAAGLFDNIRFHKEKKTLPKPFVFKKKRKPLSYKRILIIAAVTAIPMIVYAAMTDWNVKVFYDIGYSIYISATERAFVNKLGVLPLHLAISFWALVFIIFIDKLAMMHKDKKVQYLVFTVLLSIVALFDAIFYHYLYAHEIKYFFAYILIYASIGAIFHLSGKSKTITALLILLIYFI